VKQQHRVRRRTFSVSKEYDFLTPILDKLPNASRFICEAIIEKMSRIELPGREITEALRQYQLIQSLDYDFKEEEKSDKIEPNFVEQKKNEESNELLQSVKRETYSNYVLRGKTDN
jgi:hypothetical protein